MSKSCLNCQEQTDRNFCSNCGQNTQTHRITIKHFLLHDLLHGIWHLEKGIFFTIKETFVRPGQAALDYIGGKRIRYYNVFYLALLIIGTNLLLNHWFTTWLPEPVQPDDTPKVTLFFKEHLKTILFSFVPILGTVAYFVFRRLKLNIAEHFILSGICLLGILILSIFFTLSNFINSFDVPSWLIFLEVIFFFLMPLFPFWVYYNAARSHYSLLGFLWRIVVFYIAVLLLLAVLLGSIIYLLTDGKGEFYINM